MTTRAILRLLTVATAVTVTAPALLNADTLNLNGVVTISQDGSLATCLAGSTACQDMSFSGTSVVNPVSPSDPGLIGAAVTLPGFGLGWNGTTPTFDPASGAFSISYGANSLSGDIAWESFTGTGAGGYQLNVGLSNLTSIGTDTVLNAFASSGGLGSLTFQLPLGPQTVSDLFANTSTLATSISGTLVTTPEPATLPLLTCSLIALGFLIRKRRTS